MMTNWPEVVPRLVRFAQTPPFYANSDDQTLLNDVIVSAVLANRSFLGSTARFEAKNRYNPYGLDWDKQPESREEGHQMRKMWRQSKWVSVPIPWASKADPAACAAARAAAAGVVNKKSDACPPQTTRYVLLPVANTDDHVGLAGRTLFAHLPFAPGSAITHLTAARGFSSKVSALQRIQAWHPDADQWGGHGAEAFETVHAKARGGGGKGGGKGSGKGGGKKSILNTR